MRLLSRKLDSNSLRIIASVWKIHWNNKATQFGHQFFGFLSKLGSMSANIWKVVSEGDLSAIQRLVTQDSNILKQKDEVKLYILKMIMNLW